MKLLLTSNGFYTNEIREQFLQLINGDIKTLNVAIITTASSLKEKNQFAQKARNDFKEMGFRNINFIDVEFESPEILLNKDVIYINGGNPFHLLFHMKKSGADRIMQKMSAKDVVIVGVSAGSVILGPHIKVVQFFTPQMNVHDMQDLTALRLTDKLVFPHYDREDLFRSSDHKSIEERLKEFESMENCQVTRLKDHEYLVIEI